MNRVLILGGTGEARELAVALRDRGVAVISSLAGRVSNPRLPVGEVRIGGFGGADGLRDWLRGNGISAVVDATHPYAATITAHAVTAARAAGVPLLRLCRPAWTAQPGDNWVHVPTISAAAAAVGEGGLGTNTVGEGARRVFLTTGRQDVTAFSGIASAWFLIRVVDPPESPLPPHHELLRSRGPYRHTDELTLMRRHRIDTLVTKNSGGALTHGKLTAARELAIPVIMIARPDEMSCDATVPDTATATEWVVDLLRQQASEVGRR
ncbi:MAG: cobalt-precorrin-6A reductase [Gordonia sp. (in: high G+C Gram-positive bacteria)]